MSKKASAVVFMFLLFALVGSSQANPDWPYYGADWKYVTTLTGAYSQTAEVLVPNQAHWRIIGNCTTGSGGAKFGLLHSGGGTVREYSSAGLQNAYLEEFSSGRGPATLRLEIEVENVNSYTLVIEYDANAPTAETAPRSPSPSPSPSQSPSPQETKPEPFPKTLVMASIVSVTVIGLALQVYFRKRTR